MAKVTKREMEEAISRRYIGELAPLLTLLGLGSSTDDLPALIPKAISAVKDLRAVVVIQSEQIRSLEHAADSGVVYGVLVDKYHEKQWRALDLEDCVHISGPWVSEHDTRSESEVRVEMAALQAAGYDLRLVMYQRCSYLSLTKQAHRHPGTEDEDG